MKHLKHLDDEHTEPLYSPNVPTPFPHMQKSVSKNLSERVLPISQRMHRQPVARKLAEIKKESRAKIHEQKSRTIFGKNKLEANKLSTFVAKGVAAH